MTVRTLTTSNQSEIIAETIHILSQGGLVVYPTETTYGIGADCENEAAIAKLISYKSKRDGKPLSVAVANQELAHKYVEINDVANNVYQTFLPGPVTVVSKSKGTVAKGVTSTSNTVGIRIPNYPFTLDLLRAYGKGITATGANASYQKRPYTISDIFDNISDRQKKLIDLVIDAGGLPHNEPSTVIDTTLDDIKVMRFGDIGFSDKETVLTHTPEETIDVASSLLSRYRNKLTYFPLIFALTGEMGAGKTHFAKGIAQGLHVTETVSSPTYSLSNEYQFTSEGRPGRLIHIDTWRMETHDELAQLDLDALLAQKSVLVIEWADRFTKEIQELSTHAHIVWIKLESPNEFDRTITISHPSLKK